MKTTTVESLSDEAVVAAYWGAFEDVMLGAAVTLDVPLTRELRRTLRQHVDELNRWEDEMRRRGLPTIG